MQSQSLTFALRDAIAHKVTSFVSFGTPFGTVIEAGTQTVGLLQIFSCANNFCGIFEVNECYRDFPTVTPLWIGPLRARIEGVLA